uniref:CUE domain-containing protein n=2 Tax=Oryza TaxID=4527 RepID=A0A0E0QH87_ORYRU
MSAVVCGKRASSSFFEDLTHPTGGSPPAAKRTRCGGAFFPPPPPPTWPRGVTKNDLVARLSTQFPAMSLEDFGFGVTMTLNDLTQMIEKALDKSGNNVDSAIRSLLNLHLESVQNNSGVAFEPIQETTEVQVSAEDGNEIGAPSESAPCPENFPSNGSEWVELLVNEMTTASNMDDAKSRATRVLEAFEKAVVSHVNAQGPHDFQKENAVLKGQMESLTRENTILKRAFAIQHERQKDYDAKNQELQDEKQRIAEFQEQVRNLELNNYRLSMLLRQAQQGSSIPGRFNPDVF